MIQAVKSIYQSDNDKLEEQFINKNIESISNKLIDQVYKEKFDQIQKNRLKTLFNILKNTIKDKRNGYIYINENIQNSNQFKILCKKLDVSQQFVNKIFDLFFSQFFKFSFMEIKKSSNIKTIVFYYQNVVTDEIYSISFSMDQQNNIIQTRQVSRFNLFIRDIQKLLNYQYGHQYLLKSQEACQICFSEEDSQRVLIICTQRKCKNIICIDCFKEYTSKKNMNCLYCRKDTFPVLEMNKKQVELA